MTERHLSLPAAACMLLVWQQPTDRALAGWTPMPGLSVADWDEQRALEWWAQQVTRNGAEAQNQSRGTWALDRLRRPQDPEA